MGNSTVTARYDAGAKSASAVAAMGVGDMRLKASFNDETLVKGVLERSQVTGLVLGVEKPLAFAIDYDVGNKSPRFQFRSTTTVGGKTVKWLFNHAPARNTTAVDVSTAIDKSGVNTVGVKYDFAKQSAGVRFSRVFPSGTIVEPSFDFGTKSWSVMMTHTIAGGDSLLATYDSQANLLLLNWGRASEAGGAFRVGMTNIFATAGSNGYGGGGTDEQPRMQSSLSIEKTWNFRLRQFRQ
ncbi:hypothetical protein CBR_g28516 [Chara braunii]|uniref:Uncharacterized protein n=1 Tax=Chara braunii TaxID=69332 RepID=A0A388JW79_CHABU|nr:hypothetical protein CBR_g28516 [Chara braunii]|eukprot:GBG62040.1 hypothetical protein CBR_g28516 [Chara braunii]